MVIKLGAGKREYGQIVSYGHENTTVLDKLCAFLLAIAPILQHYRGIYENAGITVYLVAVPFLCLRLLFRVREMQYSSRSVLAILPLLAFELYTALNHFPGFARLLYIAFMMVAFLCVACGCINTSYYLRYATAVMTVAGCLLILQYLSYYLLHFPIPLEPHSLLVDQNSIWIQHGHAVYSPNKLYRPSAFFLEPSHLFLYSFPLLCVYLLSPDMNRWRMRKAVFITLSMLLSTSGMGVMIACGLWLMYFILYSKNKDRYRLNLRRLFSARVILVFLAGIVLFVLAFLYVPVFRNMVTRIFYNESGSTAIEGRIGRAMKYVSGISGMAVWRGQANVTAELDFNLAGFFATYIKWGVIGIVLTYWFYLQGLVKLKRAYFWLSAVILMISFFTAHTHGTFYMMYFVIFLANGYAEMERRKNGGLV